MSANPNRSAKPHRCNREAAAPRVSLYDEVTNTIIAELEQGRLPWVQPWGKADTTAPGLPRNALTARPYSGVNVLILWGAVIANGWPSQSWLTYRQAREAGGNVIKGQQGTTVVYADRFVPKTAQGAALGGNAAAPDRDDPPEAKAIPFLKRFTVFNVAQCEGLREGLAADPAPLPEREIIPVAEHLIEATGADFRIGGDKAYFVPSSDYIQVPPQPAFFEQVNYYRTCFHELGHWSGHPSRLNRNLTGAFGSKDYSREELVAELASAFICASLGIAPTVRHADYIAAWIDVLKEDNRAIFRAASLASKAADFILAFKGADARPEGGGMILLPHPIRFALRANGMTGRILAARGERFDPLPVLKLFNPVGAATLRLGSGQAWIATELDEDDDTLFGLADLGFGSPELGNFSLREIASVRLAFGLFIERDEHFEALAPLSLWAETARREGSIIAAEAALRRMAAETHRPEIPPPGGG